MEDLINLVRGVKHLFNTLGDFNEGNGITQFMPVRNTLSSLEIKFLAL